MTVNHALELINEGPCLQLPVGNIDRQAQGVLERAGREMRQRLLQHLATHLMNQAQVLGHRDEYPRGHPAVFRIVPARKGLHRGRPAGCGVHHRLVVDLDLFLFDRR